MAERQFDTAVAIVGGGPVGLVASLLLARHGIESTVIERNRSTSEHPKAHVINNRTMEIFRSLGLDESVRAEAIDPEALRHVRWVSSLTGRQYGHLDRDRAVLDVSPTTAVSCAQDRVEEILLDATDHLSTVMFDSELVAIDGGGGEGGDAGDGGGLSLHLTGSTAKRTIRARYAIGADGAASTVRELLGIDMIGPPDVATLVGTYFHADLEAVAANRPSVLYWVLNTGSPGVFIALDGRRRWMFHSMQPEIDPTTVEARLRTAIGDDRIGFEIKSTRPWRMTAQVAARFRSGRVFLAGDAAHRFPPTGGLGLNTGVQDAHNLAWKLARVLNGHSPESLLASYEQERRPVAEANCRFSLDNFVKGGRAVGPGALATAAELEAGGPGFDRVLRELGADIDAQRAHFGGLGRDLGVCYESGALCPDKATDPSGGGATAPGRGEATAPRTIDPGGGVMTAPGRGEAYVPTARPGARAPHVWLADRNGRRLSTLDLFGADDRPVVITSGGSRMESSPAAATVVQVGTDVTCAPGAVEEAYGLGPRGFVVVRPDGHVAYRSVDGDGAHPLDEAVAIALT